MNSRLTVSDCKRILGDLFSPGDFMPLLNQAQEHLIQSGHWKSSFSFVAFDASTGYLTLPYEYLTIMGINVNDWTPPVFSEFHRYIESGPGRLDQSAPCPGIIMDMGDGFASLVDIPTAGSTLRITVTNAVDAGKTIRLYGTRNGAPIFDANGLGFDISTVNPTANTVTPFDTLTGIEMPVDLSGFPALKYSITISAVAPDATVTLLSTYYPPDTRPSYRRYQTGTIQARTDGTKVIQCLCQRRFIPAYVDTDWVYPPSIRAIKAAMQAVQCEDASNYQQAGPLWTLAYDTLNKMTHSARGNAKPEWNFQPLGVSTSFPDLT